MVYNWPRIAALTAGACIAGSACVVESAAQTLDEAAQASADPPTGGAGSDYDPGADEALFLLVSINGRDTGLVAEFAQGLQSQRISAQREELEGIGIAAPPRLGRTVFLDQIPGLSFVYDAPSQVLHITARGAALIPVEISAVPQQHLPEAQAGLGVALNYRVTANLGNDIFADGFRPRDAFASLDLRAFTPIGVLTTTGSVSSGLDDPGSAVFERYDTFFTVSRPGRMMTLTAGDFTTSGPAWARPVRLGGLQIRRDFSLRDDVVTSPLLSFSGSPAVPSSIEVYVDNVRAYSGAVASGPFNLSNVPMITSAGEAVFVLRDAAGNEQTTMVPFFATQNLLTGGMLDYSLEAGRTRLPYGDGRSSYGQGTALAVSLRYGVSDRLTVETRAEALGALTMAGLGVHTVLFNRAEVSLAGGASVNGADTGSFVFGALRTELGGVGVRLSTRRTFDTFQDLASAASHEWSDESLHSSGLAAFGPVTALDALALTFPLSDGGSSLGVSLINSERADLTNTILSASYSRQLPWRGRLFGPMLSRISRAMAASGRRSDCPCPWGALAMPALECSATDTGAPTLSPAFHGPQIAGREATATGSISRARTAQLVRRIKPALAGRTWPCATAVQGQAQAQLSTGPWLWRAAGCLRATGFRMALPWLTWVFRMCRSASTIERWLIPARMAGHWCRTCGLTG